MTNSLYNSRLLSGLPSIGVAFIVRNAAATLARAVESVRFIANQIVVVDTGSTDGTPQLAARLGAEVYFREWDNDFSAARNFALRHIRTEWILSLDADEELDEASFRAARHLMASPETGGLNLVIANILTPDGGTEHRHRYTRIFRRNPAIAYTGKIHEQIAESILDAGYGIAETEILIRHNGYINTDAGKIRRNAELLRAQLAENPRDEWTAYHLGLTEFAAGNLHHSSQLLTPLLNSGGLTAEQREIATIRCAQIALANDDVLRVDELLAFTSTDTHREGLRQYILAAKYSMEHEFDRALRTLLMHECASSRLVDAAMRQRTIDGLRAVLGPQAYNTEYHRAGDELWAGFFSGRD
ncbi:MAG: glycosyltransferase family 2 protein [Candidatus Kapabacteria bacterium]|nr:glycosyltransferase family 2 protein [Candidatus Kapabacteria bacterium]